MTLSVLLDTAEGMIDDFLGVVAAAKDQETYNGRVKWLTAIKQTFLLSALATKEDVISHWNELGSYDDTAIKDFVIEGASMLYLAALDYYVTRPTAPGTNVPTGDEIWVDLVQEVAIAASICRMYPEQSHTDKDFIQRGFTSEELNDVLQGNPWLLTMYVVSKLPLARCAYITPSMLKTEAPVSNEKNTR